MIDPELLNPSLMVTLAASKFIETAAKQAGDIVTPLALQKASAHVSRMWELIKQHFAGNKRATLAIAQVEKDQSEAALAKLKVYLDDELSELQNQALARELRQVAQQIIHIGQQVQTQQWTSFEISAQDQSKANAVGKLNANNVSFGDTQSHGNLELALVASAELWLIHDILKNRKKESAENNTANQHNTQELHASSADSSVESDASKVTHANHLDSDEESNSSKVVFNFNYDSTVVFNYEISDENDIQETHTSHLETALDDNSPEINLSYGTSVDSSYQSTEDPFDKSYPYQGQNSGLIEDEDFESLHEAINFDEDFLP